MSSIDRALPPAEWREQGIRFETHPYNPDGHELVATPRGWLIRHPERPTRDGDNAVALAWLHEHATDPDSWTRTHAFRWRLACEVYERDDDDGTLYELFAESAGVWQ